jgi:hypothetical protein
MNRDSGGSCCSSWYSFDCGVSHRHNLHITCNSSHSAGFPSLARALTRQVSRDKVTLVTVCRDQGAVDASREFCIMHVGRSVRVGRSLLVHACTRGGRAPCFDGTFRGGTSDLEGPRVSALSTRPSVARLRISCRTAGAEAASGAHRLAPGDSRPRAGSLARQGHRTRMISGWMSPCHR